MPLKPVKPRALAVRIIPRVTETYRNVLQLEEREVSIGMLTATSDDATFVALDHATKAAEVRVAYAESFYAGAGSASGPLSGEVIGILAGPDPSEVRSGLDAALEYMQERAWFFAADEAGALVFFPHVVAASGAYLSAQAQVPLASPLAYLIAPPIEAMYAMDLALKAAAVQMKVFWGPPSQTNFAGCLLTGTQSACQAAADAFTRGVLEVARGPLQF